MHRIDASFATPRFDLQSSVRQQAWDWLLAIGARTDLAIEIVDDRGAPSLPLSSGTALASLRRLLVAPGTPPVRSAVSNAVRWNQPQQLRIDHLQVACYPLLIGRVTV